MQLSKFDQLLLALRLTFGVAPGPYKWGAISESICNLAMAILQDDLWDPQELFAPNQHLVPTKKLLDGSIPFGEERALIIDVTIDQHGMHDIYFDDFIAININILGSDNMEHGQAVALLAIDSTACRSQPNKPIPPKCMDAQDKLIAEAGLNVIKLILGRIFDFRHLPVSLPKNKFIA
jgi:hypothetical protein